VAHHTDKLADKVLSTQAGKRVADLIRQATVIVVRTQVQANCRVSLSCHWLIDSHGQGQKL